MVSRVVSACIFTSDKEEGASTSFDIDKFHESMKAIIDAAKSSQGEGDTKGWFDASQGELRGALERIRDNPSVIGRTQGAEEEETATAEKSEKDYSEYLSKLLSFYDADPSVRDAVIADVLEYAQKAKSSAQAASTAIGSEVAKELVGRLSQTPNMGALLSNEDSMKAAIRNIDSVFGPSESIADGGQKINIPSDNMRNIMRQVLEATG